MKRTFNLFTSVVFIISFIFTVFSLSACQNTTGVMLYHETFERMQDSLSFTMKTVPDEENPFIYGSMDRGLGEIQYTVLNEGERMNGTLTFRMAETSYAEKIFTSETPGIAGTAASEPVYSERIGNFEVSYYVSGSSVFAVWGDDDYSYSLLFSFSDEEISPAYEDIKLYVIAIISTK